MTQYFFSGGALLKNCPKAAGDAKPGPPRQPAGEGGWGAKLASNWNPPRRGVPWGGEVLRLSLRSRSGPLLRSSNFEAVAAKL